MIENVKGFEPSGTYTRSLSHHSTSCFKIPFMKNNAPVNDTVEISTQKKSTGTKVGHALAAPFKLIFKGSRHVFNGGRQVVGIPVKGAIATGGAALSVAHEIGKVPVVLGYEILKLPVQATYQATTNLTKNIVLDTGKEIVKGAYDVSKVPFKVAYKVGTAPIKAIF